MKKLLLLLLASTVIAGCAIFAHQLFAAEPITLQKYEFVTIRWAGRDNTHLIRSNGKVEMLGPILRQTQRPDRIDERAYFMNLAMNAVAKEGFEFAGMTADEIVMKRSIQQ